MKLNQYIRPTVLGAGALLLSACSYGGHSAASVALRAPQAQASGTSELKQIADQLATSGDHAAAIPIYRHLGAKGGDPAALSALADSLIAQGANDEAVRILKLLIDRGQASPTVWYALGKTNLARGHFEGALLAFNAAARQGGSDAKIRSGRAIALAALGRTSEAIASFQTGSDRLTLSNKALVLAATGRAEAAILVLEPILKSGKGTSRDRQNLAMAYLLSGQEAEAFQIARLDLDPATIDETFTFYRSLSSLEPAHRMQALVTGLVNPQWTRDEDANLALQETSERTQAAKRLVKETVLGRKQPRTQLAAAPKPSTSSPIKPTKKPKAISRADYVLKEIPPLVEPEGWALQIGAYRTIKNLMRGWTILYRKSGDLLEGIPPRRSEVDFGDRDDEPSGFYFRLNAGPLKDFSRAKALCKDLRARGTSCWIRPPEKTEGKLPTPQRADSNKQSHLKKTHGTLMVDAQLNG